MFGRQLLALMVSIVFLSVSALTVSANTHSAASTSYADVNAAVSASSSGDTVVVPAGTATWNSQLVVTKAITIQGSGQGGTIINSGINNQYGAALIVYAPSITEATKVFELSGFTLNGANISGCFLADAPDATHPITSLKVHDNNFINGKSRGIILSGMEFGVFYKNTFSGHYIAISSIGAGDGGWNYPHAFGSANYPYFEDNTFGNGAGAFITESGQGGRLVFRYNTITGYACSGCEVFDIHGDQGDRGSVSSEFYNNTVDVGSSGTYRWMNHRGGQAIIANNTISRRIAFNHTEYKSWGGNGYCEAYPARDQISNSFYFNNVGGVGYQNPTYTIYDEHDATPSCGSSPWDAGYVVNNREFWLPLFGLAANRPSSASSGTYYGATDTGVISLYNNGWSTAYSPYTYPHPLRTGGNLPAAPSALHLQ